MTENDVCLRFTFKEFIFEEMMLFEKLENKTPSKITHYMVFSVE